MLGGFGAGEKHHLTAAHGGSDAEMVAPLDSAAETEASAELGVWINQDEGVDADSFVRWVPDDDMSRQFNRDNIKSLLNKIATDDKCMTVIGFQEFPYTAGNTLKWNDREVEREYWVRVDGVDKRLGGDDNLVIFHVHYAGKWHPVQAKRDRSVIQQVNMRHTTKRMEKAFHKKCEDLDKWREAFGTAVPDIPKEGWEWKLRPDVSPGLHKVLTEAERCTTYVRSIGKGGGQRGKVDWAGLRVAGLCIGVGEYKHLGALNNAVRDAEQVNAKLNTVPSCRSDIVKDPKTKTDLKTKIRKRLEEPRLQEQPPELFCLYYAGHAFEHGAKVYLVPTDARLEHVVDDCDDECLSLDSLMQLLREKLDLPVRQNKGTERAVVFVIVLDSCRNAAAGRSIDRDQACQVPPDSGPLKYTVFFSCSRTTTASDGPSGGHSPFVRALLDAEGGFFAQGVTLRDAISNVSRAVEQGTQQIPIEVRITVIPQDFCIWPKPVAQPGPSSAAGSVGAKAPAAAVFLPNDADGAGPDNELVCFLISNRLHPVIAKRLSEYFRMESKDDFADLKPEDFSAPDLSFLHRWERDRIIKLVQELVTCAKRAVAEAMTPDNSDSASVVSQSSTLRAHSEGSPCDTDFESDSEDVLIAARNGGDCADFQVHMQSFIKSWRWHLETDSAQESSGLGDLLSTSWTACMFLWIRFARDATLEQRLRDKWLHATTNSPNQDQLLSILTECLESPGTSHPRWSPAESCECRKEHAAGISFTDAMVEHALRGNENAKQKWRKNVVQDWFHTDEPSSAFLSRANTFVRDPEHSIKGTRIFESLVETQSYVVFLKMSGLAASLLFGFLEARKLDFASAAGAAGGDCMLLHGFTSFVSSEGHAFSLSKTGVPASHVIVQGLQCLMHLAHTCWEVMGPVKTAQAFLLRDDRTIELDAQVALSSKKKGDAPLEDGSDDNGSAAELHDKNRKEVKNIYNHDVSRAVIPLQYQTTAATVLTTREGSMEGDAANVTSTKETPKIDEPEWLCCPIANVMFRDPVMVPASGTTYEFSTLEKWWKGKKPKDLFSNEELWSTKVITNMDKRREVDSWLQTHPDYVPSGWESRDIPPPPKPPRYVTQEAQAVAASSHADRDDVSPHAGQDVQTWRGDPKKEFDGAVKMQERPQEEHAGTVGEVEESCKRGTGSLLPGTDSTDMDSNPELREIFEAISKDPLQSRSALSTEPFFLDADEHKSLEPGASGNRKFERPDVNQFLRDLGRNLGVASVVGYQDFPYTGGGAARADPFVEREYWLKLSVPGLGGTDGYAILHVHYAGKFYDPNQSTFTGARSTITQINIRHTWNSSQDVSERFHLKCADLDKWRERKGSFVLGPTEAPHGWKWRDDSQRKLTWFTSSLQALLEKGEKCKTAVRKKYVEYMQGAAAVSSFTTVSRSKPPFEEGVRDAGWSGLRLAALCIGVGAYSGPSRLDNPVRDAEALFQAINKCPDCRAAILRDPQDRNTMTDHLCDEFLEKLKALSADKLPEVVALVLAGHGMQHESNVFLIPAKAEGKCDSERKLKENCLSHTTVLEYLLDVLDSPARKALKEVKFVLIMDMCRVPGGEFDLTKTIREPDQNKAPVCWSICYSTSRGSVAADGAPGSHSPLVLGLLDPQSGIFAHGVSLKKGIENAREAVKKQSSVAMQQCPINIALDRLGDFTMHPAAAESRPYESSYNCSKVSKRKREINADLLTFLEEKGVRDVQGLADVLAYNEVYSIDDLQCIRTEDVKEFDLGLMFRRKILPILLQDVAHSMSSRGASPTPSDRSDMNTAPSSPLPPSDEVIGIHVERSVSEFRDDMSEFRDDMRTFIRDFLKLADQPAPRKWKLCELLIVAFMQEKGAYDPEIAQGFDFWRSKCLDPTVNLIDEFHEMMLALEPPIFTQINHEFSDALSDGTPNGKPFPFSGGKRNHISIFVIDWMVQHSQYRLTDKCAKSEWAKNKVVLHWFNPNNTDSADDFLDRAESFLIKKISCRDQTTWGTKILGNVIQTNSYVVFFRMEPLVALLLREYCKQQQILHAHQQMQLDSEETAPKSSSTWPLAITLMVSSSNWHLPLTDADDPGSVHVSEIVGRLRRIACLPSEVLEDNECSLDKVAFVDWEPLYNLKGNERAEATSMPSGDSGGPSSGPSPPADAMKDCKKEMKDYVKDFKDRFGFFEDAASGEKMKTEETSIYVQASLSELGKDLPEFRTEAHGLNSDDAPHDADRMRQLIEQRETSRRSGAEGEEERRMFLKRLGYDMSKDTATSPQAEKTNLKVIESAEMLLHMLLKGHFMCLIGPPASGKTVTMLQVACAAADAMQRRVDMGLVQDTLLPRIPIFMRAVELSTRMKQAAKQPETLEALVKIYVRERYPKHQRIADMLIYFLELRRVLIFIDGLDEAAGYRCDIEKLIDKTAEANDMCLMVSTRDYAFETSRINSRFGGFETLGAFEAFTILPLDEQRRGQFFERRLKEDRQNFHNQLVTVMKDTPEMATSPFLLALMIQVFKKDHKIPAKRSDLYNRQVDGILLRYAPFRQLVAPSLAESSASLKYRAAHMIFHDKVLYQEAKSSTDVLEALRACFRAESDDAKSPISLREFVEVLAFVCQMRVQTRDFQWSEIQVEVQDLWKEEVNFEDVSKFVLDLAFVGLLSRVGEGEYRFSHLTLQEYLAASFVVNHFGHDAQELFNQFKPLYSPWKRMVLQFTACMLSEQVFDDFCQLVLASDDGTGSHCELVQDFLKERGASEKVERMVRDKLQEIRGSERLIAGLCHPSLELRRIVLSEMKKFGVPPDPFAETDGTAAALRQIAEDGASKWHTRAAALLSLVQMAQMDHCRKGNGRSDTLQWLLAMLTPDQSEDVRFALVAGLGTLLKGFEQTETENEIMLVAAEDEPLLLSALKTSENRVVLEAVADLKAYSDGLMDWVLKDSSLIAKGVWPMRHLLHVFCIKTATSGNQGRAEKLGQQLFGRVHAATQHTFKNQKGDVVKGLEMLRDVIRDDILSLFLHLLKSGQVEQRSRVIKVAAEVSMRVERESSESLDRLAQVLLSDVIEGCTLTDLLQGGSLLAALLRDESKVKHESLRESSKVFQYLVDSLGPAAEEGLVAPKRVVDWLLEFENLSKKMSRKRQESNQEEKGGKEEESLEQKTMDPSSKMIEEEAQTEHMSDTYLAGLVEDFAPRDLLKDTPKRHAEKPLHLYCAARLWAASGLIQTSDEAIADWLSLSSSKLKGYEERFEALRKPGMTAHAQKHDRWEESMPEIMRDERRCLGRLYFTSFLEYIREGQKSLDHIGGFERIEDKVRNWQPSGASGQLEQQLLLKELCIGRRVEELPSWSGVVSDGQLIEHLKGHFTENIAAKICSKLGIEQKKDLFEFSESDINGLGLMDPHRKILLQLINQAKIHRMTLIEHLQGHFTEEIASKICSKLGIVKTEDLVEFSDSDINGLGLMDPHRKILLKIVNEAKIHQMAVAGAVSLKERDLNDNDSYLSGADTGLEDHQVEDFQKDMQGFIQTFLGSDTSGLDHQEDDVDFGWESLAIKHSGNPEDFQKDMQGFIQTFLDHLVEIEIEMDESAETFSNFLCPALPEGEWTYCMFVWIRFAKEASFDETSMKLWRECIKKPAQQTLLARLDGCLKQESTRHKLWPRSDLKSNCSKEFAAAIYVTDVMVRHHLKGHAASLGLWERDVVKGWFEPENVQDALVFLLRANKFLREHVVDGIQVVENVVKTQSLSSERTCSDATSSERTCSESWALGK